MKPDTTELAKALMFESRAERRKYSKTLGVKIPGSRVPFTREALRQAIEDARKNTGHSR